MSELINTTVFNDLAPFRPFQLSPTAFKNVVYNSDSFFVQVSQRCSCSPAAAGLLSSWHLFDVNTDFYRCSRVLGELCTSRKFC